jgi:hypothetical protein
LGTVSHEKGVERLSIPFVTSLALLWAFPMKRVLKELGLKRIIYPCINMFPMKRVLKEERKKNGLPKSNEKFPMKGC